MKRRLRRRMIKKASLKLGYLIVDIALYIVFWILWRFVEIIWDGKASESFTDTVLSAFIGYFFVRLVLYFIYDRPKKKENRDGEK
jgi:hypothetical protein